MALSKEALAKEARSKMTRVVQLFRLGAGNGFSE